MGALRRIRRLGRIVGRAGSWVNVLLGLAFAAALALDGWLTAVHGGDWPFAGVGHLSGSLGNWRFEVGVGAAVCAAALLRSGHLALAAAAGIGVAAASEVAARLWHLPGQPGGAATLGLLVLTGSAVRALPRSQAVMVAVAGVAVAAAGLVPPAPGVTGGPAQLAVIGWPAALAAGLWLRSVDARRRATIEAVRREERVEMARELHDVVAHHIAGIVLQAQAARTVGGRRPEMLDNTLAGIETAGAEALAATRRVVGLLRHDGDGGGVAPGPGQLTELVSRFAGHGPSVAVHLPAPPGGSEWPAGVAATVYRVVQEALANVLRHAPGARSVTVTVAEDRRAVTVEVANEGAAAAGPLRGRGGYGLVGMRERVEALGGTFQAGPVAGAGWSIVATLPIV